VAGKILIVDDNPDIIGLLRANLRMAGFETAEAMNGKIALRRVGQERPDLILLDLMMPILDGWGVLDALGQRPDRPPVIVITAAESPANEERARRLGAAGYVTKPFDVADLLDLIRSVIDPPGSSAGAAGSARAAPL
jgi:CheY-like chemotaxis protein